MISSGQRLATEYYNMVGKPTKRVSSAEFNKDAEYMADVKMMLLKAGNRSKKFYDTVLDWAKDKSEELKLKHSTSK